MCMQDMYDVLVMNSRDVVFHPVYLCTVQVVLCHYSMGDLELQMAQRGSN